MTVIKTTEKPVLKLYQSGFFEELVDYNLPASTFFEIGSVNLGNINPSKVSIFVYGNYVFEYNGLFGSYNTYDLIVLPGNTLFVPILSSGFLTGLDGGYELVGDTVSFGFWNNSAVGNPGYDPIVPITPYQTARIYYSIFYY